MLVWLQCRFCVLDTGFAYSPTVFLNIRIISLRIVCVITYDVMRNPDAIIRISNHVCLNPGLQRTRPLSSGVSDKLTMPIGGDKIQ